ncbi:MAG: hypothetical protein A4E52_01300 [Pelotomaculum sp. PtaB.Bin013]|uniref:Uncharacterized protein n=1 Tax=Pelotomaculum isophthalicicum JI TaxID=947010 RepID=A0A9X4GZM4_9FIRM|nr:hypothetical protein [Pelotomaculum isophthalicicum]MDF9408947.1 hypothetical protein [Pelotomaculum isophthalicicum JI]OPX87989.1 MAG: hypothetical protein A4E52_01300 [Pelotomaculum sp. PtaB.Bin013]
MSCLKKTLGLLVCLALVLSLLAGPALAKGFSSGGRSSFSSGSKSTSSGKSYSSSTSSYSSKSAKSGAADTAAPSSSGSQPTGASTSNSSSADTSKGKGYTTETQDFSTPRQGSPPALSQDYQTGKSGYSTGNSSYSTGKTSYNGTWDRTLSPESDRFPAQRQVGVFGSPPQPPYYYHNRYWSMPAWSHLFFTPNYYYTPWGYHYFMPSLLTWVIILGLLGLCGYLIYRHLKRSRK